MNRLFFLLGLCLFNSAAFANETQLNVRGCAIELSCTDHVFSLKRNLVKIFGLDEVLELSDDLREVAIDSTFLKDGSEHRRFLLRLSVGRVGQMILVTENVNGLFYYDDKNIVNMGGVSEFKVHQINSDGEIFVSFINHPTGNELEPYRTSYCIKNGRLINKSSSVK